MKRGKTKRRRKTQKRRIKKRNKTNRKNIKGGDNKKKIKYNCNGGICVPNTSGEYDTYTDCFMNCLPLPPPPVPIPIPPLDSLNLISNYTEIKKGKLYMLIDSNFPVGNIIFLFIPSGGAEFIFDKRLVKDNMEIKSSLIDMYERGGEHELAGRQRLYLELDEKIIIYFDDNTQYKHNSCLFYKTGGSGADENDLCISKNNIWHNVIGTPVAYFSKPLFDYISTKYEIYEFDNWPDELPRIPSNLDPERDFVHIPFWRPLQLEADSESPLQPSTHYG